MAVFSIRELELPQFSNLFQGIRGHLLPLPEKCLILYNCRAQGWEKDMVFWSWEWVDLNRSHQQAAEYLHYWVNFTEAENTHDGVGSLCAFTWLLRESTRDWKWLFGPAIIHVPRKCWSVLWDTYCSCSCSCSWLWWAITVWWPGGICHFGGTD